MKNSLKLIVFAGIILAGVAARSDIDFANYEKDINVIQELESSQQWNFASIRAMELANQIVEDAELGKMLGEVDSSINAINQETLVQTEKINFGVATLSWFGFLRFLNFSSSRDITEMVLTNPDEVAAFSGKIKADRMKLRQQLISSLKDNVGALYLVKLLTAKAIFFTQKISDEDLFKLSPYLRKTISYAAQINLVGMQNIMRCETNNYIEAGDKAQLSVGTWFLRLKMGYENIRKARTEKSCADNTTRPEHISPGEYVLFPIVKADLILNAEIKAMELRILTRVQAPPYPKWNSPYFGY